MQSLLFILVKACIHNTDSQYSQLHQPRRFYQIIQKILTERHVDASDFQGSSAKEIQLMENEYGKGRRPMIVEYLR